MKEIYLIQVIKMRLQIEEMHGEFCLYLNKKKNLKYKKYENN